jgi:hypothetical protein
MDELSKRKWKPLPKAWVRRSDPWKRPPTGPWKTEQDGDTLRFSAPLPVDEEGFIDRRCPSEPCRQEFKIHGDDLEAKTTDEIVHCPFCNHTAKGNDWYTEAQFEFAKQTAIAESRQLLLGETQRMSDDFNRSQPRDGWLRLSLSVENSPNPVLMPCGVAEIMRQKHTCETCGCRYASIGAAFFCPACGGNSVLTDFLSTLHTMRRTITEALPLLDALAPDTAADVSREMVESSFRTVVECFEAYSLALFRRLPGAVGIEIKMGVFQRLDDASELWSTAAGISYEGAFGTEDFGSLKLAFRRRHLLTHTKGIVDERYVTGSGDCQWAVGQRIVVQPAGILRLAELVERLGRGLIDVVDRHTLPNSELDRKGSGITDPPAEHHPEQLLGQTDSEAG